MGSGWWAESEVRLVCVGGASGEDSLSNVKEVMAANQNITK